MNHLNVILNRYSFLAPWIPVPPTCTMTGGRANLTVAPFPRGAGERCRWRSAVRRPSPSRTPACGALSGP